MHLTKVAAAILFALTQTSESSLHYAGLDPMISKAVFFSQCEGKAYNYYSFSLVLSE